MFRLAALLLVVMLSACGHYVPVVVDTSVTTYFSDDHQTQRGTLSVQAVDPAVNKSFEFSGYFREQFEKKLSSVGYTIELNPTKARYIAFVSYGIDDGESRGMPFPGFGPVGSTTHATGQATGAGNSINYSGTATTVPTYGNVGSRMGSDTVYTRAIAIDVMDATTLTSPEPRKIYQIRAKSTGACSDFNAVFESILD